ncbi:MAG: M16 family metallopeptidase [Bacteroidota bacterium]
MNFSSRLRVIGSVVLLLSINIFNLGAQGLDAPLPFDNRIKTGELSNGLKYFIKPNPKPEKKVELRLAINAGSLLENEDQQGMAHFIEHMNFNGTEHYPKNELVDYLQSIGVQFGADLNAYTGFDETVYILPIPTTNPENVEKGFEVLSDWAQKALFTDNDINEERSVVLEESRGGKGADDRMMRQYLPKLMAGSPYANRLPIGKDEIIQHGSAELIRAFHRDWYRPNLMAVVVAGDITVEQAEALIAKYFSSLTNPASERPRINAVVPTYAKTEAMVLTDKEATIQQFMMMHSARKKSIHKTVGDYREGMVQNLFLGALNNRFAKLTETDKPPYLAGFVDVSGWARDYESFQMMVYAGADMQISIHTALGELKRVRSFGFNQTEIDVIMSNMVSSMEKSYNERRNRKSSSVVDELVRHFLQQESVPGTETEYQYYLELLPTITVEEVNQMARKWLADDQPYFALATGPSNSPLSTLSGKQLLNWVKIAQKQKVVPNLEKAMPKSLLSTMPKSGSVVSKSADERFGTQTLTLSNGITVTIKPTDFKSDEIILYGMGKVGSENFAATDAVNCQYMTDLIPQMGYGSFTPSELGDFLAGKYANVGLSIASTQSDVSGSSTVKDLETLLQLTHLKMTSPRKDETLFKGVISVVEAQMKDVKSEPQSAFMDSTMKFFYHSDPRSPISILTEQQIAALDPDKAIKIHQEVFGNAEGFQFFLVGNVLADSIQPLLEKYLGSLPVQSRGTVISDAGLRPIQGLNELNFYRGAASKSMIVEKYYGSGSFNKDFGLHADMVGQVMDIKIIEELREKIGGIYSGGMQVQVRREPYANFSATVFLPCGPESVDTLLKAAHRELEKLKREGPTEKDLEKVKKANIESYRESVKTNGYWVSALAEITKHPEKAQQYLEVEARINAVTIEELKAAANVLFSGVNVFRAILYPAK